MMGEVRRHFRDYGWAVHVPRSVKDVQPQLTKARADLSQKLGRAPNASEIAEHLGIERQWVVDATIAGSHYSTRSTDVQAGPDDQFPPIRNTLGDVDPGLEKVLDIETVRPLIAALPDQQRTVLTLRFFENMTQTQIGERLGYSQMHISRLLTRALDTLRSHVRQPDLAVTATQRIPRRPSWLSLGYGGGGRKLALSNLRRCCVGRRNAHCTLEGPATIRISSVRLSQQATGAAPVTCAAQADAGDSDRRRSLKCLQWALRRPYTTASQVRQCQFAPLRRRSRD